VLAVLVLVVVTVTAHPLAPLASTALVVESARLDRKLAHLAAEPSAVLRNRRISRGTLWLPAQANVANTSTTAGEPAAAADSTAEPEPFTEATLSTGPHAAGADRRNGRVVNHGLGHLPEPAL
jgi:hypothetical protein